MSIGPLDGKFVEVRVKSIHDDFRNPIEHLAAGRRGCLGISVKVDRKKVAAGMIICHKIPPLADSFLAEISLKKKDVTVRKGYNCFINAGLMRSPARYEELFDKNKQPLQGPNYTMNEIKYVRIKLQRGPRLLEEGATFTAREGRICAIGRIVEIYFND